MIRQFRKYAHRDLEAGANVWHWLSIAQHHGLPTRLLDWTNSPLVALHFATVDIGAVDNRDPLEDAAIWSVDFGAVNGLVPGRLFPKKNRQGRAFTVDDLAKRFHDLSDLDREEWEKKPFMTFFEPPSIDARIVQQYALFSMLSNAEKDAEEWLIEKKLGRKVRIAAGLKPEIRDRLDMMNITERVLVPGLDGLAQWLERYYGESRWTDQGIQNWKKAAQPEERKRVAQA